MNFRVGQEVKYMGAYDDVPYGTIDVIKDVATYLSIHWYGFSGGHGAACYNGSCSSDWNVNPMNVTPLFQWLNPPKEVQHGI